MTFKPKKWQIFIIIIFILLILIIVGIIQSNRNLHSSKDGIYYLIVENQVSKRASLDKTSWIEIDGSRLTINENDKKVSYDYDVDNKQFEKDSKTYFCLFNHGFLTIGIAGDKSGDLTNYVSPKSKMYSGYENGTVKIEE